MIAIEIAFIMWLVLALVLTMEEYLSHSVLRWLINLRNGLVLRLDQILYQPIIQPLIKLSRSLFLNSNDTRERNPMEKDIKIYRFSRGEKYQCQVRILADGLAIFENIVSPPNATAEVVAKLIDDAEREAMKLHNKVK